MLYNLEPFFILKLFAKLRSFNNWDVTKVTLRKTKNQEFNLIKISFSNHL
jgi:hypothetical protein